MPCSSSLIGLRELACLDQIMNFYQTEMGGCWGVLSWIVMSLWELSRVCVLVCALLCRCPPACMSTDFTHTAPPPAGSFDEQRSSFPDDSLKQMQSVSCSSLFYLSSVISAPKLACTFLPRRSCQVSSVSVWYTVINMCLLQYMKCRYKQTQLWVVELASDQTSSAVIEIEIQINLRYLHIKMLALISVILNKVTETFN